MAIHLPLRRSWMWALAACAVAAIGEVLLAGNEVGDRFSELLLPPFSPPLWAWAIIGALYYVLFFFLLNSLLRTLPTPTLTLCAIVLVAMLLATAGLLACASGQRSDPAYRPLIRQPTYAVGSGPGIWIDEAHNNIVATKGRYVPFVAALRADGYVVKPLRTEFSPATLADVRLLVIGNALHARNVNDWSLPTPSAFSSTEIRAVHEWVLQGGALLLLVDHMPFPGAAADLVAAFGIEFLNGFVEDPETWDPVVFRRAEGTLTEHPVTDGFAPLDRISTVATFDGSAFRAPAAHPVLILGSQHVSYHPRRAWDIDSTTSVQPVVGWLQGAVLEVGKGRVAVFADATMFSAQIGAPDRPRLGMNTPEGAENLQFLRNVLRWLTRHPLGIGCLQRYPAPLADERQRIERHASTSRSACCSSRCMC